MVKTYAPHFTNWLVADATFVRTLNVDLQSRQLFVDALIEIVAYGEPGLLLPGNYAGQFPQAGSCSDSRGREKDSL
ncbi:MAG TPA: hypothetical protein VKV20_06725 [Ktedonobacteraceae bacterium]|jgi:hypothetical protein|nr:hypothetical protein [Ktedonobacteraceae bacterium]